MGLLAVGVVRAWALYPGGLVPSVECATYLWEIALLVLLGLVLLAFKRCRPYRY